MAPGHREDAVLDLLQDVRPAVGPVDLHHPELLVDRRVVMIHAEQLVGRSKDKHLIRL